MPYFQHKNVNFHYEEMGSGETIIALHGLSQNSAYWTKTGVAEALAQNYRVVTLDIRAHGLTTLVGEQGYNVETMAEDITAFADHLGIDKFHLLGHSTGGMIAVRYAMVHSKRLHSLLLTNCGSATKPRPRKPFRYKINMMIMAASFQFFSWSRIVARLKENPGPLYAGVAAAENSNELFDKAYELMLAGNGKLIASFIRQFYNDPDTKLEGLANIICPTLIISAELDHMFKTPSEIMAQHIAGAQHVIAQSIGHMTALEAPEWLSQQLLSFLKTTRTSSLSPSS